LTSAFAFIISIYEGKTSLRAKQLAARAQALAYLVVVTIVRNKYSTGWQNRVFF
jgi:hypothetical protein